VEGAKRSRTITVAVTVLEDLGGLGQEGSGSGGGDEDGERKGFRIAWISRGWSHWQLHSERVMEFIETEFEDGTRGTEYICWETYGGLLGPAVKGFVGTKLIDRFGDYAKDVKGFCEGGASKA